MSLRRVGRLARKEPGTDVGGIEIVPMRRRHLREVTSIEVRLFPRPWTTSLYLSELAQPATRRYYVAMESDAVVGYAGMMLVVGEGHITTIGVSEAHQRRGIAKRLLLRLVGDARAVGADSLTLEVRASNVGAQRLYHSFGFAPGGIRKNYYPEVNEDAIVMWAYDIDTEAYAERLAGIEATLEEPGVSKP
jgi:[ribosomal protein S18]-alanine N-acetyltransferase